MVEGLLWIISIYALSAGIIHIYLYANKQLIKEKKIFLLADHSFYTVEWILRSWMFMSWVKGSPVHITVLNADEETEAVVERLSRRYPVRCLHHDQLTLNEQEQLRNAMLSATATVIDAKLIEKTKSIPSI